MILQQFWKNFRLPLLVGAVFGLVGYFLITHYANPHEGALGGSILFGFWMFCFPFGMRIMSTVTEKLNQGTRLRIPLIVLIRMLSTVSISLVFAPIFFVIQIIIMLVQFWKINKEEIVH
ncbi:hypothetical protein GCM10009001_20380 [Virgibacillus siamensis]|uniref:ATP synthase subunit I n=1 Tax=Virgibacillus siamensis TaxID=480071 RepID=A0ABP3R9P8_9BACI